MSYDFSTVIQRDPFSTALAALVIWWIIAEWRDGP